MAAQENPLINIMHGGELTQESLTDHLLAKELPLLGDALLYAVNQHKSISARCIWLYRSDTVNYTNQYMYDGRTPLYCAVVNQYKELAKELL